MAMAAPLKRALLVAGHMCARFSRWQAAVRCILAAGPPGSLDDRSRGRLLYALMMCGPGRFSQSTLTALIRNESNQSPLIDCWLASAAQRVGNFQEAIRLYKQAAASDGLGEAGIAASRMALLLEEIASGAGPVRIATQLNALSLAGNRKIILVSLSALHLPLFDEWLRQARNGTKGEIVALGLDATAVAELRARLPGRIVDLSEYFLTDKLGKLHAHSKHALWIVRTLLIRELVSREHCVLSSDLDAFIVGDVDRMLDGFPGADIVIQEDFSIPMEVARRLGFILCCGFMYLRPTQATKAFLERFVERAVVEMDDQLAINHMIYRAGVSNLVRTKDALSFESGGVRWLCPAKSLVSRDFTSGSVVRHFQPSGETIRELRAKLSISSPPED